MKKLAILVMAAALPLAAQSQLTPDEQNTIDVVKKSKNSVVYITNIALVRDFFWGSEEKMPRGSGSGYVWDDKGHIVTNFHVIEDGVEFLVTLPNQEQRNAKLVGKEESKETESALCDSVSSVVSLVFSTLASHRSRSNGVLE